MNKPKTSYILFVILVLCRLSQDINASTLSQQPDIFRDSIYDDDIASVLIRNNEWEMSLPVIELNSGQKIELLFDDISDGDRQFSYTLTHCDDEWHETNISKQRYLQGFTEGEIKEYHRSFNTTFDYINYRLVFPEEDMQPYVSGNYAIVVYERGDPDNIILTRRFYIVETIVEIIPQIKRPLPGLSYETGQLVNFSVNGNSNILNDPDRRISAIIKQNNRDDNAVRLIQPQYIRPGRLDYTFSDRVIFQGGSEFRNFDMKNLRYISEFISQIEFIDPWYHVHLKTDIPKTGKPYFYSGDLNGAYYVDREKATDKNTEADYAYVHFTFEHPELTDGSSIFVFGMLSDWKLNDRNRMLYNREKKLYELVMLLKQGWYDYKYVIAGQSDNADEYLLEGSHFEAANSYTVFVYVSETGNDLTRLAGVNSIIYP